MIEYDIVSEEFKAVSPVYISLFRLLLDLIFDSYQALDNDIVYLWPHEVQIYALLFKVIAQCIKAPFKSTVIIICIL